MKVTTGLLFLGIGFIAGIMLCSRCSDPVVNFETVTETVIKDTVIYSVKDTVIYKDRFVPYEVSRPETPEPIDLHFLRTYKDSVLHTGLTIIYEAEVLGFLQSMRIRSIKTNELHQRTITNTITNTLQPKPFRGVFAGVGAGANKEGFQALTIGLSYVNKQNIIGYDYNIIDGSHNVKISRLIFKL